MRRILVFLILLVPVLTFGQVKVLFPDEGTRDVWIASSAPDSWPADSKRVIKKEVSLDTSKAKPDDRVWVWDQAGGNIASKAVKDIQGVWVVAKTDFALVGMVALHIEYKGQPVSSANVSVKTGKRTIEKLLDPSAKGELRFYGIEPGSFDVKVGYNSKGKAAQPLETAFKVKLARDTAEPSFTCALSEEVATVTATEKPASKAEKPGPKSSIANTLLNLLVGLGLGGALIYFMFRAMKANESLVKDKLRGLGVEIPEPGEEDDSADLPPMPVAPLPPEKIVLDAAVPTPSVQVRGWKLVGQDGTSYQVTEGLTQVSRESAALGLEGETTVSRQHAELSLAGGTLSVRDLESTNGTFINGNKVAEASNLALGDVLQFGAARFRVEEG